MAKKAVNFSTLSKVQGVGWISSETPGHTIINFFSLNKRSSRMVEVYAYLHNATISELNIVCAPSFTDLLEIQEEEFPDNPDQARHSVRLVFEDGYVSFFYKKVHFQTIERETTMMMGKKDDSYD
jgi:hypothetical protein